MRIGSRGFATIFVALDRFFATFTNLIFAAKRI